MEGWIKLHRKMTEWEWYKDNNTKILFLHLLLTANHKEQKWQGHTILRGQTITSLQHLADETNLSLQQIRTALNKLKSTHEITYTATKKYTLITIEKYNNYQGQEENDNIENNTQNNNIITINKNDKNIYLYLLNKYRVANRKDFSEYLQKTRQLKEDEQYNLLTAEEQLKIVNEL